jgi:predicted permease
VSNLLHFSVGARITSPLMIATALGFLSALTDVRPHDVMLAGLKLLGDALLPMMLFAALRPAVMQFMLADRYHHEPDKVGAMIMLGNAQAVVFVPLALALAL